MNRVDKMGLKNVQLKRSYDSDIDDILNQFYIPVLGESIEYKRMTGYFTSNSLAIASRGLSQFISNGGHMKLICGAVLGKQDVEIINNAHENPKKIIEESFLNELEDLDDGFVKDHVKALGWMLAKNLLEIKIAFLLDKNNSYRNDAIFHQKIGIFKDSEDNMISFSGSNNETLSGWTSNIEEFKVFTNWNESENHYFNIDLKKFNSYWEGSAKKVELMDIPTAIKNKLIKMAPKNLKDTSKEKPLKQKDKKKKEIKLWDYQLTAIEKWAENNYKGIFEMATGTGKTFTALGCLKKEFETSNKLFAIITCPYQHLVQQWKKEVSKFGLKFNKIIIADSSTRLWKDKLVDSLIDLSIGDINSLLVITTHRTFSSNDLIQIIKNNTEDFDKLLIADEVHGLGAELSLNGLISEYSKRLGLSATPKRWFDDYGTDELYEYFGNVIFKFPIDKAINTINPATQETYLTPYEYLPKLSILDDEELDEYLDMSKAIGYKYAISKNDPKQLKQLQSMIFKRANIIKNAVNKYEELEQILDQLGNNLKWTIIYCSNEQIEKVMKIVNKRMIKVHRFTMNEGTKPEEKYGGDSEREFLIKKFAEGEYECLVAMKCLDEGVDIPPARIAILMSSSGNPREYIQRIGRVIRRFDGKEKAIIYDIMALPPISRIPSQIKDFEREIFQKEQLRYEEIAKTALNNVEALKFIFELQNKMGG